MAATLTQYNSWSPELQARYRKRYGAAPKGFTPFVAPTAPPPGTYDPALEQAKRAAGRGYEDLFQDTTTNSARAGQDLGIATANLTTTRDRSLADLGTNHDRSLADLLTQQHGVEHSYDVLRSNQEQGINAGGASLGGALQQAARKRAANEQLDLAPIGVARDRSNQDYATNTGRVGEDYASGVAAAGLTYKRGQDDATTQIQRAGRELGQFGQDTAESEFAQAAQGGYIPPEAPKNEFTRNGVTYRRVQGGYMLPNGHIISHAQLQALYKK